MTERSRRLVLMLGLALLCPVALASIQKARDRPLVRESPPPPIRRVGCPQLRVTSSDLGETGWLGAAAATLACDRVRVRLGGAWESALPPGALLFDTKSLDARAFEASDATARQRSVANARTDAVVEGELDQGADYRVTLRLVDRIGNEVGKGNGAHVSLVGAIRMASDMMLEEARLSPAPGDTTLARTMPSATPDAILAVHDLAVNALLPDAIELWDTCESVMTRTDLGMLREPVNVVCSTDDGGPSASASAEILLRALLFDGHARSDERWLPWQRLTSIARREHDAAAD
jgi:hypothetical protein